MVAVELVIRRLRLIEHEHVADLRIVEEEARKQVARRAARHNEATLAERERRVLQRPVRCTEITREAHIEHVANNRSALHLTTMRAD